jgi:formate C-acetyltransferase
MEFYTFSFKKRPESYGTLCVRVSGWNARFVTLCKEWQDMVIAQNDPNA